MKEDLKKLRDMNKDDTNSQANVVKSVEDEDDVFLNTKMRLLKQNGYGFYYLKEHLYRLRDV